MSGLEVGCCPHSPVERREGARGRRGQAQVGEEGELRAWGWADSGGPEWLVDDALSPSRAFLEYYQEHLEYACPTEDIYLE